MRLVIKGGRLIDPSRNLDKIGDLLVEQGRISAIGESLTVQGAGVFDASGLIVSPGFVDLHVHLREPGEEYKETIASGAAAAVAGGFTSVCAMPNTNPVNDNASVTRFIVEKSREANLARVYPIGAITRGSQGEELAEIAEMKQAGAVAVSDDGRPVMNSQVMRHAMEYARDHRLVVVDHCQDTYLSAGGVMHEGRYSTLLGLKGMAAAAEEAHVARDIMLARSTGARVHIAHVSTRGSVDLIRHAKRRGLPVTCEVTPHHLALTDAAVVGFDTNTKMSPPLRSEDDRLALIEALADGTIDAIATDHAPHHQDEKMLEYDRAPFGVIGLETALGVVLQTLYHGRELAEPDHQQTPSDLPSVSVPRIIEALTSGPAQAFGLEVGTLAVGALADLTVIDLSKEWVIDPAKFKSRSRNTPFAGWTLRGAAAATFVDGKQVWPTS
ncbi:MAG TPA: dihydroorotase [Blastocatellia bacterium]|nr:dihydroorotase [Blastocatellia bacterium]